MTVAPTKRRLGILASIGSLLLGRSGVIVVSAQDPAAVTDPVIDLPTAPPNFNNKSRWLTIDEWNRYLESESGTEFELDEDPAKARELWDEAVEFEWGRCVVEGRLPTGRNCTYVLCHAGQGESGYRRKKELFSHVRGGEGVAKELVYWTIWNSERAWCGYGSMAADLALNIECPPSVDCAVTPLMMSMKMMPETIGRLMDAIEELYGETNLTELIDGSRMRKRRKLERKMSKERKEEEEERRKLRKLQGDGGGDGGGDTDAVVEGASTTGGDPEEAESEGGPTSRDPGDIDELPAADFYLAPGVIDENDIAEMVGEGDDASDADVTKYMTDWLLARTGSADPSKSNETTGVAVEATYWTSSRAAHLRENEGNTDRAQFWEDVYTLTLKTTDCDDTFRKKLIWTADLRLKPDFSILTVKYDDANERDIDAWCVVAMVSSLSAHVSVVAVEIRPRIQEHNVNAAWMVQSGLEGKFPWFDHGLDGTGQVVSVSDTGIDKDNCYFWDQNNGVGSSHRKIVEYKAYVDDSDYKYGHGTHVAGTIVGQRTNDGGQTEVKGAADGVAKGAKVAFIDIGDAGGALYLPRDSEILGTGRAQGAHVHSASWGSVGVNYYSSQSRSFDDYMYKNPDFLINVAAGNDGRGNAYNTVSSPATFKNGLAVGCSHGYGEGLAFGQLGPAYVADFSSKGPTADGRMTPMVVAPGKYILSAGAVPSETGECDGGIPDAGDGTAGLKSMAGTSMATPVVSATAALVQQYFREGWYPTGRKNPDNVMEPSAALIKAVLMNGAQTNMKGVDNGRGQVASVSPYDNVIGFGRIDLIKSLYIAEWSDVQARVWDDQAVADGSIDDFEVTIDRSGGCTFKDLSVTLVWVEKASVMGCSKCVVNDLDLTVEDPAGTTHYPNGLTRRDDKNNAERIVLRDVQDGATYRVSVEGYNLDDAEQRYALVATGCFGGVRNRLNTAQDAFQTDDSADQRTKTIIITVCSVVGGLLFICCCCWFVKRRRDAKGD